MPKKVLPRIDIVEAGEAPLTLHVRWSHGGSDMIDVSGLVNAFRLYVPLRDDPDLFRRVRVGEHGSDIVWTDTIDMSNETLWRLAQEQSGATMTAAAFRQWRERHRLTLDTAARALGLSRRTIAYYDQGKKPIPRIVALATRGWSGHLKNSSEIKCFNPLMVRSRAAASRTTRAPGSDIEGPPRGSRRPPASSS